MILPRVLHDELVAHAQAEAPLECCGIVACLDGRAVEVHRCTNAAESLTRYEIDGQEQFRIQARIDRLGLHLGAIYHSHTLAEPYPSRMDVATAFHPDALYIIVGVRDRDFPEVRAFRIAGGEVMEELLEVRG